jgi:hypothetical protein
VNSPQHLRPAAHPPWSSWHARARTPPVARCSCSAVAKHAGTRAPSSATLGALPRRQVLVVGVPSVSAWSHHETHARLQPHAHVQCRALVALGLGRSRSLEFAHSDTAS